MNSAELTGALAWPLEIESMAGLTLSGCPSLPPSQALLSRGIIYGDSIEHGTRRPVAADWPGLRHHTVVLGPTGVGKTTLMVNTATQVMHTMPSAGILVVDAKGDLIDQLLERLSEHDINRVVVVAPEDERPVGINPFKLIGVAPGLAAEQMTSTVHRMWESSWGPRTHDVISHAFATIAADPDGSLVDLGPLLSDTAFRKRAIGRITDPVLRQFWRGFENYSEAERQQVCAPALSRWRALMSRLPLRRTFSQPHPKFDLRTALDGGRIVLVRLSAGELGEDATALFGAVLMNAVWNVVQGRNTVPVDKRRPLLVMADEFQRFTSFGVPIEELLSQARSFNVAMMLGLQHLAQVPEKVHTSILSNVRSKITFQLGQKDAKLVATEFGRGLTSEDFQGLARYEVVASLFAAGRTQPPCTLDTRSPAPSSSVQPDMVRAHSRDRWGTPAEEIDAWVAERLMPPETPHELRKPPGRKRRDES